MGTLDHLICCSPKKKTHTHYPAIQTSLCASGGRSTVHRRRGSEGADWFLCLSTAKAGFADVETCSPLSVSFLCFLCLSCALTLPRSTFDQLTMTSLSIQSKPLLTTVPFLSSSLRFTRRVLPANFLFTVREDVVPVKQTRGSDDFGKACVSEAQMGHLGRSW